MDTVLSKVEERFEQIKNHLTVFDFLNDLDNFFKIDKANRSIKCKSLENMLHDPSKNEKDLIAEDLCEEIENITPYISPGMDALDVIQYIYINNLIYLFPNLAIAIRIFLTLPVTVASGERSFSKLKIIKNYLRSTMGQERLSDLAIISIEKEISEDIDVSDIISEFALKKARKAKFF